MEKRKRGRPATGRYYDGYGVYEIICVPNGKIYVGSSTTVYNRICNQKCRLREGRGDCNSGLYMDYIKYGESNFLFKIVEKHDDKKSMVIAEQALIDRYRNKGISYNIQNAHKEKLPRRARGPKEKRVYMSFRLTKYHFDLLEKLAKKSGKLKSYYIETLIEREAKENL